MPTLNPYNSILGKRKAKHLLRRATYCFNKETIEAFSVMTAPEALMELSKASVKKIDEPKDPLASTDDDINWLSSVEEPKTFKGQGRKRVAITAWWWYNAFNQTSIEHKLTYFLHSCFTVAKDNGTSYSHYFYDHLRLLQHYSMGNIKTLANKITLDHAMLFYLDNNANNKWNPNENYAREYLELFTILKGPQIGEGNYTTYTEHDIQMAAKVFSGYKNQNDRSFKDPDTGLPIGYIKLTHHDTTDKTFSAAFGGHTIKGGDTEEGIAAEHQEFVDMLFNQDATAISYVRKMYKFFVKSEWESDVEKDIIEPLAAELKANGYEILPIISKLLSSEHFFDADDANSTDNNVGAIVKDPMQLVTEMFSMFQVPIVDATGSENWKEFYHYFFKNFVHNSCLGGAGLIYYSPDTVAGYPANYQGPDYDRHWFTSTAIISRYKVIQSLLVGKDLIAGWGKFTAVLDAVKFFENNVSDMYDADLMIDEVSGLLYPESIDDSRKSYFKKVLLEDYDKSYWSGAWGDYKVSADDTSVRIRLNDLITAMANAAEFQLM